jgi:hypothetical protein
MPYRALLVSALLLAACTTTQGVTNRLGERYTGRHIDQIFISYGPPVGEYALSNGESTLTPGRESHERQNSSHTRTRAVLTEEERREIRERIRRALYELPPEGREILKRTIAEMYRRHILKILPGGKDSNAKGKDRPRA